MEDLLRYYQEELAGFRRQAAEFAGRFPKVASRLDLSANESSDPHVERLIEAFALLCTRARLRAEARWPAVAQSALQILYPDLMSPIPAMSIARFEIDPEIMGISGLRIPRGTQLLSRPIGGEPCQFRTCFDLDLWPLTVTGLQRAAMPKRTALELRLRADAEFFVGEIKRLTVHLQGSSSFRLYEILASRVERMEILRDGDRRQPPVGMASPVRAVGFDDNEAALPPGRRSFAGFRLLREYLCMAEKFLFLNIELPALHDFGRVTPGTTLVLRLFVPESTPIPDLDPDAVQLSCTPIVNLFSQSAEPILLNQRTIEYQVIPDILRRRTREIYSIDEVTTQPPGGQEARTLLPIYDRKVNVDFRQGSWTLRRSVPALDDDPMEVHLSVAGQSAEPAAQANEVLMIRATCSNVNLPSRMNWGVDSGDLQTEGNIPIRRIRMLRKPTARLLPPLGDKTEWVLISHMALQHLSLSEDGAGVLRRLLHALDVTNRREVEVLIDSIGTVQTDRAVGHITVEGVAMPVQGTRIEVGFRDEAFVEGGAYLFGSVLDRFLSLYGSINSFTQLRLTSPRKGIVGNWPPRSGTQTVI
jgi:type VI secretion system protein ImpG